MAARPDERPCRCNRISRRRNPSTFVDVCSRSMETVCWSSVRRRALRVRRSAVGKPVKRNLKSKRQRRKLWWLSFGIRKVCLEKVSTINSARYIEAVKRLGEKNKRIKRVGSNFNKRVQHDDAAAPRRKQSNRFKVVPHDPPVRI